MQVELTLRHIVFDHLWFVWICYNFGSYFVSGAI